MEMVNVNSATSPHEHAVDIASAQSRHPSLHLIEDRRKYFKQCIPLYKLALKGDWKAAKHMIDADTELLKAAITKEWGTLLHVAAGTDHVRFVKELVKLLNTDDLEVKNCNGNTAFCSTVASGNLQIAAIMIEKNGQLLKIQGAEGMTPLYMAAIRGKIHMARFLYNPTIDSDIIGEEEWNALFFLFINNDWYDLALKMLQKKPMLALVRNKNNDTGLHVLARKPSGFSCQSQWYLPKQVINSSMKRTPFVQLVGCLWRTLINLNEAGTQTRTIINQPSQITFDATEIGNFHFIAELMTSDPDLIWEVDNKNRNIIHIAVLYRHSSIFRLIHEVGSFKDWIVTFQDDEENNILHYAAKLTPPHQLNSISGAALQMTHELLWFQDVKKLMPPSEIKKKNSNGKTPDELFADEHKELFTKAESWIKITADYSLLVSTLIFTGVFTSTFTIPGGNNKKTGTPNYLEKPRFMIFAVSDAITLMSSSVSILFFLSILISSYAGHDHFKSLPLKLLLGLVAQIISITSMMVAFSVSFFINYYHGSVWVPDFISVLVFLPLPLFTVLLFPLWSDIIRSSYFCMSLFRPRKVMLN